MKRKRTIRIAIEREREVVIRRRESREAWCPACGARVQLVTVADENETDLNFLALEEPDVYSSPERIKAQAPEERLVEHSAPTELRERRIVRWL
ncbi:MAG: hypothetical protein ABI596_16395 [Pyrinomonadaceae bacterium]